MDLGDRVKIKNTALKFFGDLFHEKGPLGVIVRKIEPANSGLSPQKTIFFIRWDAKTENTTSANYIISDHLELVEVPSKEWLLTHQDEEIRAIGKTK